MNPWFLSLRHYIEAVSSKLAKQVLDHYGDFVQGMNNITALHNTLDTSGVILKNGRRYLNRAKANVGAALTIAESHTKKRSLLSVGLRNPGPLIGRHCITEGA